MSCKHGNWEPCDECEAEDALYADGVTAGKKAAKDAEIERLKEERLGVISQSKMHPSWLEKSREEILDCLRFQGRTTALLLAETADLRKQLAAAEKQRDELLALLLRAEDAIEALDGTSVENEKLVDDYRALIEKVKGAA